MLDGDGMTEVVYVKQCKCNGTASTGRIILHTRRHDETTMEMTSTYYPEPVCDVCDTPWKEEECIKK